MHVTPYLFFNKQCSDAFRHYEKVLGGKNLVIMTYGDTPSAQDMPADMKSAVMHASLNVGETQILGADDPQDYRKPQGVRVALHTKTPQEAKRAFDGLAEGGSITQPLEKTFFSPAFGMLTDRFGVQWMVNCEQ